MTQKKTPLQKEAEHWLSETLIPEGWVLAPEAVPRHSEAEELTLTLPKQMVALIRATASRYKLSPSALIRRWIDGNLEVELALLKDRKREEE